MQPHSTPAPQQGCEPDNTAAEVISTPGPRDRDVPPGGNCSAHARWAEARTSVRTQLNFHCNGKQLHRQAAVAQLLSWLCIHLHVTLVVSPLGCGLHISNHGSGTRWPVRPLELVSDILNARLGPPLHCGVLGGSGPISILRLQKPAHVSRPLGVSPEKTHSIKVRGKVCL